ncbi:MAG: MliC family protein [Aliivibrio sp.]|uniref:MliC family protein n=1 Tax=Aliivibrio sp. TaxID=1872443 RepID=UPI001A6411B9|nr:MliC family protein [Aliivibrio sp.]
MRYFLIMILMFTLFGCESRMGSEPEPDNFQMLSCLTGEEFLITYVDKETVVLMAVSSEITLIKTESASGSKYLSEQGDLFWQKGSESLLQLNGQVEQQCKLN